MFYDLLDEYIKLAAQRVGNEIGKSTYGKYMSAVAYLKEVIPNKPLKAVDNADILAYKYHLTNKMKYKTATLCSYLTKTKAIFAYALNNGKITKNPFENIKIKRGEVNITPLTKEELMRIVNKDFKVERLNKVRDVFVFACNTALSYCDLRDVKKEDIQMDGDVRYLKKQRTKTGVTYIIPLSDVAISILEKYDYVLFCNY
jgi:integrase